MRYRRTRQPGGTHFFTVNLAERSSSLLTDHVDDLRRVVSSVKRNHPFGILAWVVMPDHLHAIWTLPENDGDCATRWMLIKAGFSRSIPKGERVRTSRLAKRRARRMATPVLGTPRYRRQRSRTSCRLRPHQSGQTRPRRASGGLAVQFDPWIHPTRMAAERLGGIDGRCLGHGRKMKMLVFAALTPTYAGLRRL